MPGREPPSDHSDGRTTDAAPQYGAVQVSLTKTGDTSARSARAVDLLPVANATYERTITLPSAIADQVRAGKGVVVRHGVDYNGNGRYDGSARSDLDPGLPAGATDPAACGVLKVSQMTQMPTGGVQTGTARPPGPRTSRPCWAAVSWPRPVPPAWCWHVGAGVQDAR